MPNTSSHFIYPYNYNKQTSFHQDNPMKTNSHEARKMVTYHHLHHHEVEDEDLLSVAPPRISFSSSDFLDDKEFISINPKKPSTSTSTSPSTTTNNSNSNNNGEFEFFFSGNNNAGGQSNTILTADELFYEGKLLPFRQQQQLHADETMKKKKEVMAEVVDAKKEEEEIVDVKAEEKNKASSVTGNNKNGGNISHHPSWYFDEDPSPRPPKCTVLWKELLRLKKQRASSSLSLSPSSSSSSTSSSSSSMADVANADDRKESAGRGNGSLRKAYLQRIRKGLERTRSGSIRIRPILNVPVCTHHVRTNSNGGGLPPMFPIIRKGRSV